jgi:rubrerythrin
MIFRCATCVFFSAHRPNWSDRPSSRGQCRRHAPVIDKAEEGRLRTVWPMVDQDAYCGDHAELVEEEQGPTATAGPHVRVVMEQDGAFRTLAEPPPRLAIPLWACANCTAETSGFSQPAKCPACNCRTFTRLPEAA